MAELTRTVIDRLRNDIATCLGAVKFLEERGESVTVIEDRLHILDRTLIQMQGRLDRLAMDHEQLDRVVQRPNGGETLVVQTRDHRHALEDLQRWRVGQEVVSQQMRDHQHALVDLKAWRDKYEPLLGQIRTAQIQAESAVQVAHVQGLSARRVALYGLLGGVLGALITGLLLWLAAPTPVPPQGAASQQRIPGTPSPHGGMP